MEDFEYVVNPPVKSPICFGSLIPRDCLPQKGKALNSFMRRITPECHEEISSNSYHTTYFRAISHPILKQIINVNGFGPLGYITPRFPEQKIEVRPNEFYDYYIAPLKEACKPFGCSLKPYRPYDPNVPGPGTYKMFYPPFDKLSTFGKKQYIIPAVKTICEPDFRHRCRLCNKVPKGDFWWNTELQRFFCRRCMLLEIEQVKANSRTKSVKLKRLAELKSYKRARYCGFYHDHQKTKAKPLLLPPAVVINQVKRENYLSKFYL